MTDTAIPEGIAHRRALDDALTAIRADPSFWRDSLDAQLERVLGVLPALLECALAQLWRIEPGETQLYLRYQCDASGRLRKAAPDAPALLAEDYVAVISKLQPIVTGNPDAPFDTRFQPTADGVATAHLPISFESDLRGVLTLLRSTTAPWSADELLDLRSVAHLIEELALVRRTYQAEQRFHALTENAPIGVLQYDEHQRVLFRNNYFVELIGADYSYFTRDIWSKIIAPEETEDLLRHEQQIQQTGSLQSRYRILRPDGSERHILWHVLSENTRPEVPEASGRIGIVIDVTEQWQTQQQLRELLARYSTIVDNAALAIIATDMSGRLTMFNPAAERLLGYRPEEVLGRTTDFSNAPSELEALASELHITDYGGIYASMAKVFENYFAQLEAVCKTF